MQFKQLFVKLASLLAQYLLAHKQLSLPGLGVFYADNNGDPEYPAIRFEQQPVDGFDESIVDFVSSETGKMRVLAISDLNSQLEDAVRFLNTGKPYLFTGIGTLLKKADGSYDFVPNTAPLPPRKKDVPITERNTVPQSYIEEKPGNGRSKKPAIIIIVLAVIAIAATIWFYSKTGEPSNVSEVSETTEPSPVKNTPSPDTTGNQAPQQGNTGNSGVAPAATATPGITTYVLEITKEPRASRRYNQLKKISWPVELEKVDSLQYAIIMRLNTALPDTAKVRDSLTAISGRKVTIRY
ncbi:hypothetical protein SAMN04487894_106229 [Niabella drilacis]|uniref:CCDC81-like prokaryotic HU domain-containing protein n=1 Tax=Niabella drilacis (strain DSM 25811 / CCM 8410 / CCUG 62505 / LMG 26954 / E90) TaxID=1285928 RepID=A0A1G6SJ85_NIADE|nr:hypothetical protein SAMN04487894_106229 [Niabella drilacis]